MARKKTTRKKTTTRKKATRATARRKTTRKKTTTRRTTATASKIKGSVNSRTKSQIFNTIAEATELSRKEVTSVLGALESLVVADQQQDVGMFCGHRGVDIDQT